jgi:hypothetical protein
MRWQEARTMLTKLAHQHRTVKALLALAFIGFFVFSATPLAQTAATQQPVKEPSREGLEFFEKKIRPVLADSCYSCHSAQAKKPQGGLQVDSLEAMLKGGASGQPAIVPGDPDKSLLITAIRYTDPKLQMPFGGKLPDQVVKDFEEWVKIGAPAPRSANASVAHKSAYDWNEVKKFWSFQPVKDHAPPTVKNKTWIKNPIDQFILAKLEEKQLKPLGDADKLTLIRRASFDLTGLPPTPAEVEAFINDKTPQAFEKVVDSLLASSAYGEKWGRHWLDVARYADTAGDNSDYPIPAAYKYRNYVIESFNKDKPYDQFIREQLAGDLLPHKTEAEKREGIIATGYIATSRRFGSRNREFNLTIDDTIDNLGKAFLGLSVSCARCHDHKFDPITNQDYYALYGIFNSTRYSFAGQEIYPNPAEYVALESGRKAEAFYKYQKELSELDDRIEFLKVEKGAAARNKKAQREKELAAKETVNENGESNGKLEPAKPETKAIAKPTTITGEELKPADYDRDSNNSRTAQASTRLPEEVDAETKQIEMRFNALRARPMKIDKAYAVVEGLPANARLHRKGDRANLGEEVPRGFLTVLGGQKLPANHQGSGREHLADWIADAKNPLTARVMVNRIWQYHFGKGLVQTPNDFGIRGKAPTHPELLDYLATRFIEGGWSIKKMHKLMMLSHAYQLASVEEKQGEGEKGRRGERLTRRAGANGLAAANAALDVNNDYLWRFNRRRLEAEEIRDAILAVSGTLDRTMGEEHPFPAENTWRFTQHSQFFAVYDTNRRSVYVMQQRLKKHPFFEVFDGADQSATTDVRGQSVTPVQALFLLNNSWLHEQADQFAVRVGLAYDTLPERIDYAYRVAVGRAAKPEEIKEGVAYVQQTKQELAVAKTPDERLTRAALASYLCVVLSSNEFLYLD